MIENRIKRKSDCMGCSACYSICPKDCISMDADREGFIYPKVDLDICIKCNLCIKVCPIISPKHFIDNDVKAYASNCTDNKTRENSSSGGLFSLIAGAILSEGGVVFGAEFDDEFQVKHNYAEDSEEVVRFRGSKYSQSNIGGTYKQAREFLSNGRKVLFTGTPCQIAGLRTFLRQDYETLYCQDVICQGVPSPLVWNKYLSSRVSKEGNGNKIKSITLRSKKKSWQNYDISIDFERDHRYSSNKSDDGFMRIFMKFLSIRPSCFSCQFKGNKRCSDITLGDFWGIQSVESSFNDDKGTSLVLVNTNKGQYLFDSVKELANSKQVEFNSSIRNNPMYSESININNKRNSFFSDLDKVQFDFLIEKYCRNSTRSLVVRKLKLMYNQMKRGEVK